MLEGGKKERCWACDWFWEVWGGDVAVFGSGLVVLQGCVEVVQKLF